MRYMTAEVIVFCMVGIITTFLWGRQNNSISSGMKCMLGIAFSVYIAAIVHYTLLNRDISSDMKYELSLFWSYEYVRETSSKSLWWEIVNNILLFVPMGVVVPMMISSLRSWWKVILCAFGCSLTVEVCQLVFRLGLFELDDMFNNTLGALVGYGLFSVGYGMWKKPGGWVRRSVCWLFGIVGIVMYFMVMRVEFVR